MGLSIITSHMVFEAQLVNPTGVLLKTFPSIWNELNPYQTSSWDIFIHTYIYNHIYIYTYI